MGAKILLEDSIVSATKANYPALVHAWEYENYNFDSKIWTDSAGDCNLDLTSAGTIVDTGDGVRMAAGSGVVIDSGTLSSFTDNLLMIMTGKCSLPTTWGFKLGNVSTGKGVGCKPNDATNGFLTWSGAHYLDAGDVAMSANDTPDSCIAFSAVVTDGSEAGNSYSYDASATAVRSAVAALTGVEANTGLDLSANQSIEILSNSPNRFGYASGVYLLEFADGLPSATEMAQIVSWMGINKRLYPGLKGRS